VGKKIRNAAGEWVPYVVVIGDNELEDGIFNVSIRETGEKVDMTREELLTTIKKSTQGMPFRSLPLPLLLSRRVNF
jgi:threonyl-tRNA synthetase